MHYNNKTILLASMHQKERAIAPLFFKHLNCKLKVHDFNTDTFGTFTGEIERTDTALNTCILKAKTAAKLYDTPLVIASEGSFGPHPRVPFLPCGHEVMTFIDTRHNWVIYEQMISQKTNYKMFTIDVKTDLTPFLLEIKFPSHALTLQTHCHKEVIEKGINTHEHLNRALSLGFKKDRHLILGTDMRAMMNPTRMEVISELAEKLALKIATVCEKCNCPGFGFKNIRGSLPCELCGGLTSYYEKEIFGCISCDYEVIKDRSDGLTKVEPTYCNSCNP